MKEQLRSWGLLRSTGCLYHVNVTMRCTESLDGQGHKPGSQASMTTLHAVWQLICQMQTSLTVLALSTRSWPCALLLSRIPKNRYEVARSKMIITTNTSDVRSGSRRSPWICFKTSTKDGQSQHSLTVIKFSSRRQPQWSSCRPLV